MFKLTLSWNIILSKLTKPIIFPDYSKKEGKDQESIKSSTAPDPGHHIGK